MATAIELKLYCSPEDIALVAGHPLITVGAIQSFPRKLVCQG